MIPSYFHVNYSLGRCEPTIWQTPYHVGTQDDYKRCMCFYFPTDENNIGADCPVESGSGGDDNADDDNTEGGDDTGDDDISGGEEAEDDSSEGDNTGGDDNTGSDDVNPIEMSDPSDAFAEIWNRRNYNESKPSRSMYQVDQSLDLIQRKLIEMYTVLHESQLIQ